MRIAMINVELQDGRTKSDNGPRLEVLSAVVGEAKKKNVDLVVLPAGFLIARAADDVAAVAAQAATVLKRHGLPVAGGRPERA